MNISSQNSVTIKLDKTEMKSVLLDYVKRMCPGVVEKDMALEDDPYGHIEQAGIAFTWTRARNKESN